eukprot:608123_1
MGSCFGRNRDQDDHQIENEDLLENGIDLESQEVIKPPTQFPPKHGASSSLVPYKQIVLAVIGALLLLGVTIGGYSRYRYKKRALRQPQLLHNLTFDTTGATFEEIEDNVRSGANNLINDVHSRLGDGVQQPFVPNPQQGGTHHRRRSDSHQMQRMPSMGTGHSSQQHTGSRFRRDRSGAGGDTTRDHPSSFAHQMQPYQGTGRHHLGMERKSAMPPPEGSPGFMALYGQNPQPQGTGHFYVDQLDLTRDDDDDDDY